MTPILSPLIFATSSLQQVGRWVWKQSDEDARMVLKTIACSASSVTCTLISSQILSGGAIPVLQVASAISVSLVASRIFTHPSPKSIALTLAGTAIVLSPAGLVHVAGLAAATFMGGIAMKNLVGLQFCDQEGPPAIAVVHALPFEPICYSLAAEGG